MRIDVAAAIDRSPIGPFQIRVIVLCGLVALLDGFDLQTMAILVPKLTAEWRLPREAFKWALSASLIGILVGALLGGPLGDRLGRRRLILAAFAVVGAASLLTALSQSMSDLIWFRFFTGIGLGACLPNIIALTTEYVSEKRRGLAVMLMFSGVPLGGTLGSVIAADVVAHYGWQAMFVAGGAIPLAICLALWIGLPESIRFLVLHRSQTQRQHIAATVTRIDTTYRPSPDDEYVLPEQAAHKLSVLYLFAAGRSSMTLLLWMTFFGNLFLFFFLLSWLPSMLQQAGWGPKDVGWATGLLQAGGIAGGLCFGLLSDRVGVERVLIPVYVFGAAVIAIAGTLQQSVLLTCIAITMIGAVVLGAQFCLNALAASAYSTDARSTGVGWALGIGRVGAIVSPLVGAEFIKARLSHEQIFVALALPAIVCALSVWFLRRARATIATAS